MHGLVGLAGLLGLVALAFGPRTASVVAAIILCAGTVIVTILSLVIVIGALQ